jgi:hypothetical protein
VRGKPISAGDSGDHEVSGDGTFCSPPLCPARYFLRFAGILRKPADAVPTEPRHLAMQRRIFDYLYPDAQDISDATGFDLQLGQTISGLQIQIPRPVSHTVRGKVTGELPTGPHRINVMFSRTMGTIDVIGGGGQALRLSSGEPQGLLACCAEDIEVRPPDGPSVYGRDAVLAYLVEGTAQIHSIEISHRRLCGSNESVSLTANYRTTFSLAGDPAPKQVGEQRPVGD